MLKRKAKSSDAGADGRNSYKGLFFDCILPGTIKFLSDHYIVGDSYRCAWVIRE